MTATSFTPLTVSPTATVRGAPSIMSSALPVNAPLIETVCAAAGVLANSANVIARMGAKVSESGARIAVNRGSC